LDIVSTIDLRSRSLNGLSSLSISVLSRSSLSRSVNNSVLLSLKINLFGVIYNFSIVNRLGYNFSCRSIESSVSVNNSSLSLSSLSRVVNNSILTSINLNSFGFGVYSRLYISLSNSQLSWNININSSGWSLVINNWLSIHSLGVYWSLNNLSSYNWSLNNSLSNDRLFNNSSSYDRLWDDFSGNNRSALNLLSLSNNRLAEKNISAYNLRLTGVDLSFTLNHLSLILLISSSTLLSALVSELHIHIILSHLHLFRSEHIHILHIALSSQ